MSRPGGNSTGMDIDIEIELNSVPSNANSNMNMEIETETTRGLSDASVRQHFILKVYGVLTIQLCFTIFMMKVLLFLRVHLEWHYFNLVVLFSPVPLIPFCCCCTNVKRESPENLIFFLVFMLVEGSILGNAVMEIRAPVIILFAGLIVAVTLTISLFALQRKCDFTALRGILLVVLVILTLNGLCAKFLDEIFPIDSITTASFFAFWFCLGLVCDTQRLLRNGGKDKKLTPDDFIYVALTIHLDIFVILYLLFLIPATCLMIFLTFTFPHGFP